MAVLVMPQRVATVGSLYVQRSRIRVSNAMYGSMNFLSREHEDDILMRLRSEAIARELLGMG